jgi:ribosomal protein S18 acetylase RimI-like enzyme
MTSLSQTAPEPWQATIVRRATPADAEALAALGAETFVDTFGHLYPPDDLAAFLAEAHGIDRARSDLADPARGVWLAETGGRAVGYALAGACELPHPQVRPGDGELKRLYLRREAQNGGLGARLFAAALAWLQQEGPRTVWIGVWSENHGAQRFYARRGFETVGEYGFRVGGTVDREFILRRTVESFSKGRP